MMAMNDPDLTLLLAQSAKAVADDPVEARKRFHSAAERAAKSRREVCGTCGVRHRVRKTAEECADEKMSESTLNERFLYRVNKYKWDHAHAAKVETPQGWRTAMAEGWPDHFLMREKDRRVLVVELKKQKEDPDPAQMRRLWLFNLCGIPAVVVRPSDLRLGNVDAILR
jgi:hypothetical protein